MAVQLFTSSVYIYLKEFPLKQTSLLKTPQKICINLAKWFQDWKNWLRIFISCQYQFSSNNIPQFVIMNYFRQIFCSLPCLCKLFKIFSTRHYNISKYNRNKTNFFVWYLREWLCLTNKKKMFYVAANPFYRVEVLINNQMVCLRYKYI